MSGTGTFCKDGLVDFAPIMESYILKIFVVQMEGRDCLCQVQLLVHHLHLHPPSGHHGRLLFKDGQVANEMRI